MAAYEEYHVITWWPKQKRKWEKNSALIGVCYELLSISYHKVI